MVDTGIFMDFNHCCHFSLLKQFTGPAHTQEEEITWSVTPRRWGAWGHLRVCSPLSGWQKLGAGHTSGIWWDRVPRGQADPEAVPMATSSLGVLPRPSGHGNSASSPIPLKLSMHLNSRVLLSTGLISLSVTPSSVILSIAVSKALGTEREEEVG